MSVTILPGVPLPDADADAAATSTTEGAAAPPATPEWHPVAPAPEPEPAADVLPEPEPEPGGGTGRRQVPGRVVAALVVLVVVLAGGGWYLLHRPAATNRFVVAPVTPAATGHRPAPAHQHHQTPNRTQAAATATFSVLAQRLPGWQASGATRSVPGATARPPKRFRAGFNRCMGGPVNWPPAGQGFRSPVYTSHGLVDFASLQVFPTAGDAARMQQVLTRAVHRGCMQPVITAQMRRQAQALAGGVRLRGLHSSDLRLTAPRVTGVRLKGTAVSAAGRERFRMDLVFSRAGRGQVALVAVGVRRAQTRHADVSLLRALERAAAARGI